MRHPALLILAAALAGTGDARSQTPTNETEAAYWQITNKVARLWSRPVSNFRLVTASGTVPLTNRAAVLPHLTLGGTVFIAYTNSARPGPSPINPWLTNEYPVLTRPQCAWVLTRFGPGPFIAHEPRP